MKNIDIFTVVLVLFNFIISISSISRDVYKKYKYEKKYNDLNKLLSKSMSDIDNKINSSKYELIIKNYSYDINTKDSNYLIFKKNKNRYHLILSLKISYEYFSNIYNDKKMFCTIRIKNNNNFNTIAKYNTKESRWTDSYNYIINQNTDLINIAINNRNKFIISNIDDFKDNNSFVIQDNNFEKMCCAIITIPLRDINNELLGCYTAYFTKPLNDKIKITSLRNGLQILGNKFSELIKEYILFNCEENNNVEKAIIEKNNG